MALKFGNTTIANTYTVKFNGSNVEKIYFDGTLVWEKLKTTPCTVCGGDGKVNIACANCANGKCLNCKGTGKSASGICTWCRGFNICWYCTGCGNLIFPKSFIGDNGNVQEWSIPYTCGQCGSYYSSMDEVADRCEDMGCIRCENGKVYETCDICQGSGICPNCGGDAKVSGTCGTCNGTGTIGGSTSVD